jgi:hypothetical protein
MQVETEVRPLGGDHVVHFYDRDDELVGVVVGYLAAAVADGDVVIMIATAAHREAFTAALSSAGVDVAAAMAKRHLQVLDAAATLNQFMVGGSPDAAAFDAVVGGVVRSAAESGCEVRAYGEMVALLWGEGNAAGAIELETLWNGLADQVPFSLFCAYPSYLVAAADAFDTFAQVCSLHSDVVGGAPIAPDLETVRPFACTPDAPRLARRFVTQMLEGWDRSDLVGDAAVVVAELASNAVSHAHSDFTVGLSRLGSAVRLEVRDSSTVEPTSRESAAMAERGRGLQLIAAIARRWGYELVAGGKVVWAELDGDARIDVSASRESV